MNFNLFGNINGYQIFICHVGLFGCGILYKESKLFSFSTRRSLKPAEWVLAYEGELFS